MQVSWLGLLAILFIGLKLGGIILWPWLWVLVPLWGPLMLAFAICVVCVGPWMLIRPFVR